MIVDAILVGLAFYLVFPLLAGYSAYHYGRSFKLWFVIGCFLPIISFLILSMLIVWDEKTTPRSKLSRRERMESEELVKLLVEDSGVKKKKTPVPPTPVLK
ncbi:MAG: hypothetical protein AAF789_01305 [Bacteroidota bacterium]